MIDELQMKRARAFLDDPYKAPEEKAAVAKRFGLPWPPAGSVPAAAPEMEPAEQLSAELVRKKGEVVRLRVAMREALTQLRGALGPNTVPEERAIRALEEGLKP